MGRQLSDSEKLIVRKQQIAADGSLNCFISGEVITDQDEIEYDHIHPFAKDGETSIANIRIVLKQYNRRKSDQSLYDVRDNLRLERLFKDKKNDIRLQDILKLKDVVCKNTHASCSDNSATISDGHIQKEFLLFYDEILKVYYFYGRIPVAWLENDDQEGLQPRVIDYKRLISIRDHLKNHPQLAPSIGRLVGNRVKLFDGQHKLAAQVLNNQIEVDVKVYISPESLEGSKKLFDALMITNLDAHSKLKQVPFYTSTLLDRLSVIYKDLLDEFVGGKLPENHTEDKFIHFLVTEKQYSRAEAKTMLRGAIKTAALDGSALSAYVAEASKDASYPMTIDLLDKTLFPSTLYFEPSEARFTSATDYRNAESHNFKVFAQELVKEAYLEKWVPNVKGKSLTNEQLKARRIWHKGSVLTWSPYIESILYFALQFITQQDRERLLYRSEMTDNQIEIIKICLKRLFSHPMWDEPEGEIDTLLVSAKRQSELFERKGLTERYVVNGQP